jgi:hypothetical protein
LSFIAELLIIGQKGKTSKMGGLGSGRPKTRERELIENCQFLDIDFISKNGGTFYPIYAYIKNEDDEEFLFLDYSINWFRLKLDFVDKTYPYFGGTRRWIICNCGKRVKKLYRPSNRRYFRCCHCYDYLTYQSQESNVYDGFRRKMAKANGMTPKQYDRMVFG